MLRENKNQSQADKNQFEATEQIFKECSGSFSDKMDAFTLFSSRQSIAKFLTKYEMFKKILNVNGSIVECGVLLGGGLLGWAKLSSILEPVNHTRKIIGFDTFDGFPSVSDQDKNNADSSLIHVGALKGATMEQVEKMIGVYDLNRPLNHIPKVELVKGDLTKTAKKYLDENPQTVVSLINLDVDLYEPSKAALEVFLPRMPKGAIIAFDQLNAKIFPGETLAVQEIIGINNLRIERFYFDSYVSYAVLA